MAVLGSCLVALHSGRPQFWQEQPPPHTHTALISSPGRPSWGPGFFLYRPKPTGPSMPNVGPEFRDPLEMEAGQGGPGLRVLLVSLLLSRPPKASGSPWSSPSLPVPSPRSPLFLHPSPQKPLSFQNILLPAPSPSTLSPRPSLPVWWEKHSRIREMEVRSQS